MSLTPVKRSDPYDFPKSMVPMGLTYQWCAKTVMGEPQVQFQKLKEDGWIEVPAIWHRGQFDSTGPVIELGGQVLMAHPHPRDEEAERIAGAQKNVDDWIAKTGGAFSGGIRAWVGDINAPPPDFRQVGKHKMANIVLAAAQHQIVQQPPAIPLLTRVPRHRALRWLFNLISVEK